MSEQQGLAPAAYSRLEPELEALREDELVDVNVDDANAVTIVLRCLPRILALRSRFEETFKLFDLGRLELLESHVWCLRHAQTRYLSASRSVGCPKRVLAEGEELRARLREQAQLLAKHGLVDATRLVHVRQQKGYRNLATELEILVNVLRDAWSLISGKCNITVAELGRAAQLADEFLLAASRTEKRSESVANAMAVRQRAYTLFWRNYDVIRAAVHYVRWTNGDANEIAPSVFALRKRRKPALALTTSTSDAPATPPEIATTEPFLPPSSGENRLI